MSNAIGDILARRQAPEPPEVETIKVYVFERYKIKPRVEIRPLTITIVVPTAALAGSLRMELHTLQLRLETTKRLTIRIGQ